MPSFIRIVLVSPKFGANVGACARVCANFGVRDLRVVSPRCDWRSERAAALATGDSVQVLAETREEGTLREALADSRAAIGFTRRRGRSRQPRRTLAELASSEYLARFEDAGHGALALVFGSEDFGLSADELALCTEVATIATAPELESMNLSHAVAVALSRVYESLAAPRAPGIEERIGSELATHAQLDSLFTQWEATLADAGLITAGNPQRMARRIRGILSRAELTRADVALFRGFLSKMQLALGRPGIRR